MERFVFNGLSKVNKPIPIVIMFFSFPMILLLPFLKAIVPKTILPFLGLLVLAPISLYFLGFSFLFANYVFNLRGKSSLLAKLKPEDMTIKKLSRRLKINPRAAFFFLELLDRGGDLKREVTNVYNYFYKEKTK